MILPIGDDNSDRRTRPTVNYVFIALNVLVFLVFQQVGNNYSFTYSYSTVPAEILTGKDIVTENRQVRDSSTDEIFMLPGLRETPIHPFITLITSLFMHGGIAHILGNMLFLFVFGDNVEDRLGHLRYAVFYLLCGVIATLVHVFTARLLDRSLLTPLLGASGAISAVLGAYLLLFPRKQVRMIILRFFVRVPAFVAIGAWFLFQVINGLGLLGGQSQGGVAYAAHIGGFAAGLLLIKVFALGRTPGGNDPVR